MRKLWVLICLFAMPLAAVGQSNHKSWDNLNSLRPGQKIEVNANSGKARGTFVSVSEDALSLQEAGGAQTIQRKDIRNVKLMEHSHRVRNVLIAGGVGAGVGAVIGAATNPPCTPNSQSFCLRIINRGQSAAIAAVVGFAAGAVVGAVLPAHDTVFSSK